MSCARISRAMSPCANMPVSLWGLGGHHPSAVSLGGHRGKCPLFGGWEDLQVILEFGEAQVGNVPCLGVGDSGDTMG